MSLDLLSVPTPGFGAMGLSHSMGTSLTLAQAEPLLLRALELGCTFWDTAVLYGAGVNESLLGDFIRKHDVRDKVFGASRTSCHLNNLLTCACSRIQMRCPLPRW
jgi:aryl-alcohol dehydrogenase-like predicted oxidoreductase